VSRSDDLPQFDPRPGIRIAHEMPDHPKIAALSDAAFRMFIRTLCYCSRLETDGLVPAAVIATLGPAKARTELRDAELIHQIDRTAWEVHDYLRHQRSAVEINSIRASKSQSGSKGAHMRWHVPGRKKVKGCTFCYPQEVTDIA